MHDAALLVLQVPGVLEGMAELVSCEKASLEHQRSDPSVKSCGIGGDL